MEPQFRRYLDWYSRRDLSPDKEVPEGTRKLISRLEQLITSAPGRLEILNAMLLQAEKKLERFKGRLSQTGIDNTKRFVLELEYFIEILPDEERFTPGSMALRDILFELCGILKQHPSFKPLTRKYEGTRPTRFERLLEEDDPPEVDEDGPLVQALV